MVVEIHVLSGARQNDQITLDSRDFRVGSDPDCEVFFDPQRHGAIAGRSAQFRFQADGWYVRCPGGEMSINGQRVAGATHVRSGDVVRMSQSGPEFAFRVVAGEKASSVKSAAVATSPPLPTNLRAVPGEAPEMTPSVASPIALSLPPGEEPRATPSHVERPDNDHSLADHPPLRDLPARDRQWSIWIMGVVALEVLALIAMIIGVVALVAVRPVPSAAPPVIVRVDKSSVPQPPGPVPKPTPIGKGPEETPHEPKKPPVDPAGQVAEAVYLLQAEKVGYRWPLATAVAIGRDTLLTTAREATRLAKWRKEGGFKVWVTRQADGFKEQPQDIRVINLFPTLADKAGDWIYADLALLTIGTKLPKTAALASSEELAKVKGGVPVTCISFAHEGEMDSDPFKPQLSAGSVFLITGLHDLPGRPTVLHMRAQIPWDACGSPVVNVDGKIIGLYGAAVPERKGLKNLHYVTLVNPEAVRLWLQDRGAKGDKIWLPASPAPTTQKTQNKP